MAQSDQRPNDGTIREAVVNQSLGADYPSEEQLEGSGCTRGVGRDSDEHLARQLAEEESALIAAREEQERRDEALARELSLEDRTNFQSEAEARTPRSYHEAPKRYCSKCGIEGPNIPLKSGHSSSATSTTTVSFWRDGPSGASSLCQTCGEAFEQSTGLARQEWIDWGIAFSLTTCEDDARSGGADTDDSTEEDDEDEEDEGRAFQGMLPPASTLRAAADSTENNLQGPASNVHYGNVFQRGGVFGHWEYYGNWDPKFQRDDPEAERLSNIYRNTPSASSSKDKVVKRNGHEEAEELERFLEQNSVRKAGKPKNIGRGEEDSNSQKRKRKLQRKTESPSQTDSSSRVDGPENKKRKLGGAGNSSEEGEGTGNVEAIVTRPADSGGTPTTPSQTDKGVCPQESEGKLSDSVENISLFHSAAARHYLMATEEEGNSKGVASLYKAGESCGIATQEKDEEDEMEEKDDEDDDDDDDDDEDDEDDDEEEEDDEDDEEEEEEGDDEDEEDEEEVEFSNSMIDDTSLDSVPETELALDFSGDTQLTDVGQLPLPSTLRSLNLSRTSVSGRSFERLPRNLGRLQLAHCLSIDDHSLLHVPASLHTLDLAYCHITALALLLLPQRLHTLVLSGCSNINNASLQQLPRTLVSLDLSGCHQFTADGLRYLPSGLQTLKLNECKGVNDYILMRQYLPQGLTSLYLASCDNVTDDGLPFLPSSLQTLDLSNNSNVSDKGLQELKCLRPSSTAYYGKVRCDSLKRLVLRGCPRVTGDFAADLSNVSVVLKDRSHKGSVCSGGLGSYQSRLRSFGGCSSSCNVQRNGVLLSSGVKVLEKKRKGGEEGAEGEVQKEEATGEEGKGTAEGTEEARPFKRAKGKEKVIEGATRKEEWT